MSAISPDDDDMSFQSDTLIPQEMNDYIRSNIVIDKKKPSAFPSESMLPTFLKEILGLEEDFLDRWDVLHQQISSTLLVETPKP